MDWVEVQRFSQSRDDIYILTSYFRKRYTYWLASKPFGWFSKVASYNEAFTYSNELHLHFFQKPGTKGPYIISHNIFLFTVTLLVDMYDLKRCNIQNYIVFETSFFHYYKFLTSHENLQNFCDKLTTWSRDQLSNINLIILANFKSKKTSVKLLTLRLWMCRWLTPNNLEQLSGLKRLSRKADPKKPLIYFQLSNIS